MSATTAGRMPLKMRLSTSLFLMVSGVRKMAMARMMTNDGNIVPTAAAMLPFTPRSRSPITTEMFTARMPGMACAMASRSRNSSFSIHLWLSTISRSMIEIIAHPPPKVNAPIFMNVSNNCKYIFFIRAMNLSVQNYTLVFNHCSLLTKIS